MFSHEPENYICPLCQIANGEDTHQGSQEDSVVFRDELVTVFVAGKWWRGNEGHVIIIPNAHIENIYVMPDEVLSHISVLSKKVAFAIKETYKCDGISTRQHNEPAGNQDVWHYHLHVFPRYENDNFYKNFDNTFWPTMEEKKAYADRLKKFDFGV